MYRRENEQSPISLGSSSLSNASAHTYPTVIPAPATAAPIATTKQTAKNQRFQANAAAAAQMQDGYFHGYYGSKQQQEYYGKYEIEFAHHQKSLAAVAAHQNQIDFHHQKGGDFPHQAQKSTADFHHIKADFHPVKPELKVHEFHGKASAHHQFHQNQNYYNQAAAAAAAAVAANQSNQVQYGNQYYHNEYDTGDPNAYYDPKSQPNYYENMQYHHHHHHTGDYQTAEYNAIAAGAVITPTTGMSAENCNNFVYPQYFEGGQHQQQQQQQSHSQQSSHPSTNHHVGHTAAAQQTHHQISQAHNHPNAQQSSAVTNFQHGQPVPYVGHTINGNHHNNNNNNSNSLAATMENSNSSSDFNFLSNLANDFAPEYYQLS